MTAADRAVDAWEDDPGWQESVAVWFHDLATGWGGFLRFGIHPTQGYGRTMLFAYDDRGLRFRRVLERVPVADFVELAIGGCWAGVDGDAVAYRWDEPECAAQLTFAPFYEPLGFGVSADEGDLHATVYAGHLECSGRLVGSLRVGERTIELDALCHRDRSWGPRRIDAIVTNRMFTGTMGPALSFAAIEIQTVSGPNRHGFVVRDGVVTPCEDLVILPSIGLDGYSVDGGVAHLRLLGGEVLTLTAETIDGQLTPWDGYLSSEHLSIARCGDLVGMCDNELTNNPRMDRRSPVRAARRRWRRAVATSPALVAVTEPGPAVDLYDDPRPPGSRWTRVNIGEAIPGVPTPLSWSLWRPAMELAFWWSQEQLGIVGRRDARPPVTGIALGRPVVSVDVTVAQVGRMPGYDPDAFAEQYFGLPPSGAATTAPPGTSPASARSRRTAGAAGTRHPRAPCRPQRGRLGGLVGRRHRRGCARRPAGAPRGEPPPVQRRDGPAHARRHAVPRRLRAGLAVGRRPCVHDRVDRWRPGRGEGRRRPVGRGPRSARHGRVPPMPRLPRS